MSKSLTSKPPDHRRGRVMAGCRGGPGRRGEFAFKVGRREIGHLHGDRAAHFSFPKPVWAELRTHRAGSCRIPSFPDSAGPAARTIEDEADVRDVIELLRLNYDRAVATHGLPGSAGAADRRPLGAPRRHPCRSTRRWRSARSCCSAQRGNLLVYSAPGLESDAAAIEERGGISRQYLNHGHEAMFASDRVTAPLFVHEHERASVAAQTPCAGPSPSATCSTTTSR